MIRRLFYLLILVTICCSLRMLYQDYTAITSITKQRNRIITTIRAGTMQPPPPQNDDLYYNIDQTINHPTNDDSVMNLQQIMNQSSTVVSTSSYVPYGHTTIFVPQHSKNFHYYYSSIEEMQLRQERFPSILERVQLYMSTWYLPPCHDNVDGHVLYAYNNTISPDSKSTVMVQPIGTTGAETTFSAFSNNVNNETTAVPPLLSIDSTYSRSPMCFLYNRAVLQQCTDHLCYDAQKYFIPYVDQYYVLNSDNGDATVPLILQHGDANFFRAKVVDLPLQQNASTTTELSYLGNPNIPIFKKFRRAMTQAERTLAVQLNDNNGHAECVGIGQRRRAATSMLSQPTERWRTTSSTLYHDAFQPIIAIVSNFGRHFYSLMNVIENDTRSWDQKNPKAIYRGLCTGRSKSAYRGKKTRDTGDVSDYDLCQQIPRCRLVYEYSNSTLVDAKLTKSKQNDVSYTIRGVPMIGRSMSMEELLQNKGIIMIEGNDVSSGLKWALFSKSVVLTQKPTYTSWAMEELLVPWVHYIPIAEDLSDVNEKVQWMIDHDEKAKEIANNGHLWMSDMIFHPHAMHDHEAIIKETFQRYRTHFRYVPSIWL